MTFCALYHSKGNNLIIGFCLENSFKGTKMTDPSNCFKWRLLFLNLGLSIFSQKFLRIKIISLQLSTWMRNFMPFILTVSLNFAWVFTEYTSIFSGWGCFFQPFLYIFLYLHTDWKWSFFYSSKIVFLGLDTCLCPF